MLKHIEEIRAEYHKKLAEEYGLTPKEVRQVHEDLIERISAIDPSNLKYVANSLPGALRKFKQQKDDSAQGN